MWDPTIYCRPSCTVDPVTPLDGNDLLLAPNLDHRLGTVTLWLRETGWRGDLVDCDVGCAVLAGLGDS